jgi:hypothetical protein
LYWEIVSGYQLLVYEESNHQGGIRITILKVFLIKTIGVEACFVSALHLDKTSRTNTV